MLSSRTVGVEWSWIVVAACTEPSSPTDATREHLAARDVAIVVHGDEAQRAALQIQLEGALPTGVASSIAAGPIDLARAVAPAPVEPEMLARVWIELAPADRGGVASLTAGLLEKGAGARNAFEFADAVANVGGSFNASAGAETLRIGGQFLARDRDLMLELLLAVPGQGVELRGTPELGVAPLGFDPALILESMERWVQRPLTDGKRLAGKNLDALGDGPSVESVARDGLENQEIQSPLEQVG